MPSAGRPITILSKGRHLAFMVRMPARARTWAARSWDCSMKNMWVG